MTSIIASSVSGGKAGGLHLGIGGRDLFVVAIFHGKYVRCRYRLFDLFFKLLHTDKIRKEDNLSMPGRNTYVVEEGIRGHPYMTSLFCKGRGKKIEKIVKTHTLRCKKLMMLWGRLGLEYWETSHTGILNSFLVQTIYIRVRQKFGIKVY
jgi:hypothetical protein